MTQALLHVDVDVHPSMQTHFTKVKYNLHTSCSQSRSLKRLVTIRSPKPNIETARCLCYPHGPTWICRDDGATTRRLLILSFFCHWFVKDIKETWNVRGFMCARWGRRVCNSTYGATLVHDGDEGSTNPTLETTLLTDLPEEHRRGAAYCNSSLLRLRDRSLNLVIPSDLWASCLLREACAQRP